MDLLTATVVAGAAAGGFVQGLSGSFFGLVALAFWAWTLDPVLAGPLVVVGSIVGQLLSLGWLRRGFSARRLLPMIAGGLAGVPIGVALLHRIDPLAFRFGVGALLALWCPAMLLMRDLPRITGGGRLADAAVGLVGGVMGGLGGLTGPAPVLWSALRDWDRDVQRAVIQGFNLSLLLATLAAYLWAGAIGAEAASLLPAVALATLVPAIVGQRLYRRFSDDAFRKLVLGLLTLSGLILVATSLPKLI